MAVLYVIIIIHELGHLLAGKHLSFPIRAFSVGIGPLVSVLGTHQGIRYEVRLLPIAGYVSLADDTDDIALATSDDTQHTPQQEIVMYAAGVLMNLLSVVLVQCVYLLLPWGITYLTGQPYRGCIMWPPPTSPIPWAASAAPRSNPMPPCRQTELVVHQPVVPPPQAVRRLAARSV